MLVYAFAKADTPIIYPKCTCNISSVTLVNIYVCICNGCVMLVLTLMVMQATLN